MAAASSRHGARAAVISSSAETMTDYHKDVRAYNCSDQYEIGQWCVCRLRI
jgi:hypothetical protein